MVCGEEFEVKDEGEESEGVREEEDEEGDMHRGRWIDNRDGTAGVLIHGKCALCTICGDVLMEGPGGEDAMIPTLPSADALELKQPGQGTVRCMYYDWDFSGRLKPKCRVCWRAGMIAKGLSVREVDVEERELLD